MDAKFDRYNLVETDCIEAIHPDPSLTLSRYKPLFRHQT